MKRGFAAVLAAGVLLAAGAGAQPAFTGVGDLPGGASTSSAFAVSADATTVVGESASTAGVQAFRWTLGSGITGIGFLSGAHPESSARAVSADGAVLAGFSLGTSGIRRAFRHSGGAFTALGTLSCASCDPVTQAYGISGNGLVAVGSGLARSTGAAHLDPVRWPGGGTTVFDLGNLTATNQAGDAFAASFDGAWIVGAHSSTTGTDAWTWSGSGLTALPRLHGEAPFVASARGVSSNGSIVVGSTTSDTVTLPGGTKVAVKPQAVRWTGAGHATVESLGTLAGGSGVDSRANAISPDGSVIVGRARDAGGDDAAFVWDAANGMRELALVLSVDYGLDLTGWTLSEATGVSAVVDDVFTVVGAGINPSGDPEGWVARITPLSCSDGLDNDLDGDVDFPDDAGCTSPTDLSEENDCEDGVDNDGDGDVDHPADAGCRFASDPSEAFDCGDGLDNDGDGLFDFPDDPGCAAATWPIENPECSDGLDNDLDGDVDHPADLECTSPSDRSEIPDCSDGIDNDGDGDVDHPADAQCASSLDPSEHPACSDGIDNDGDGDVDHPAEYPACLDASDDSEAPQCADGLDNDADGLFDFPDDPECASAAGENEDPFVAPGAGLLVVDRASRALFFVDATSGAQTRISEGAFLEAPQGLVVRGVETLVADPAGLVAVTADGVQRVVSAPLVANASLQVVLDAAGDPTILEADGLTKVTGFASGIGTKSLWLAIPVFPELAGWDGDSLATQANGDFATSATGFVGNGVFVIDGVTQDITVLDESFKDAVWVDLAVEADGTLVAVGTESGVTGLVRIDPLTGLSTPVNQSYGWQEPTAIAVGAEGDLYVADAGECGGGTCSGGSIVHVDPVSGTATALSSGGFIAGEMDLVALPEPALPAGLGFAAALLSALARRRRAGSGR